MTEENVIQMKSGILININVSVKYIIYVKKITCDWENGKYLANIINDSMITYTEIIDAETKSYDKETKFILTNSNEEK